MFQVGGASREDGRSARQDVSQAVHVQTLRRLLMR